MRAGVAGLGTLNFYLDWRPAPALETGLRLENLLDKNHREHGSGLDSPGFSLGVWARASF